MSATAFRNFRVNGNNIVDEQFGHSADGLESTNSFSERRLLEKQEVSLRDTDLQFFPHGLSWIRRCYAGDLPIGQKITFGAKEYLVFPNADNVESEIGVAVRVA